MYIQLNLDISDTDISNTLDMSECFVSSKHLFFKYFTLHTLNTQISGGI